MKKSLTTLACLGKVLLASASTTITTPGDTEIHNFGWPNTATYGQIFTAPVTDNNLDSWTFNLRKDGGNNCNFQFFVMGWNGSTATGSILYQSATAVVTSTSFQAFTFLPNLTLTPGGSYVAFINESGLNGTTASSIQMQGSSANSYAGGDFRYLNNGDTFGQVSSSAWSTYSVPDMTFTAVFSSVPEPTTFIAGALLALPFGLQGIRFLRNRKLVS
jgi:hypothetical protein